MADLTMQRGRTIVLGVSLSNDNGTSYTMQDGDLLYFGFKKRGDEEPIFQKSSSNTTITIAPTDTEDIDPGTYVYDISLKSGENIYPVVELSKLKLIDNVTIGDE